MSKTNKPAPVYFTRSVQISDGKGGQYIVSRDEDGDYKIEDVGGEVTIYVGKSKVAWCIAEAIQKLMDENNDD